MCFWCWFYFTARTSLVRAQWLEHTLALRLAARCRGGSRRRRELRKVWDLAVSLIIRSDSEDSAGKGHSDSVVPPAVSDFFGMIRLPRLSARCRGTPRRRGRSGRVWDLACIRFGCKKPHPSSIRCRGLRSSASDRSFAFGSARPSFLLSQVSSSLAPYASA